VASQEEEVVAKEDTVARTISVAMGAVVLQHVVVATSTTHRKRAAIMVATTTTTTTTTVHRHLMVMNALYAKSASSLGTQRIDVGTGSMRTTCQMRS
jgi:ABC-type tungstate transport system permease subunit